MGRREGGTTYAAERLVDQGSTNNSKVNCAGTPLGPGCASVAWRVTVRAWVTRGAV